MGFIFMKVPVLCTIKVHKTETDVKSGFKMEKYILVNMDTTISI